MEFRDQKRYLLDALVQGGWRTIEDIPENLTVGIPPELLRSWLGKFYKAPKITSLPRSLRLINRFMVGADPEFTFADPLNRGAFIHANNFNLQVGLAFGADLAGRPVELRPAPSRYVLDVVASILTELRWLAITQPQTRKYSWVSRPYIDHDGIGGHVHLGRKRLSFRDDEITALDRVMWCLTDLDIFLKEDCNSRTANTHYGKYGDVREQCHGYEYRTFPTWLNSPWLAYLTMTLAKLVVYNPKLFPSNRAEIKNPKSLLKNILAYYKGQDDDAALAYSALERFGWPKQTKEDFRPAWGITYDGNVKSDVVVIPRIIEATQADRETIFQYLSAGTPILPVIPVPNWTPTTLPAGYSLANAHSPTVQRKGIGELLAELVVHDELFVRIELGNLLVVNHPPDARVPERMEDGTKITLRPFMGGEYQVHIPQGIRESNERIQDLRKFLLKHLPIWEARDVKPESLQEFRSNQVMQLKKLNLRGTPVPVEVML